MCTNILVGLAQIVGSLMTYGIGKNTSLAIAPWRVMFLVAGGITIFAGILFYVAMPTGPANAWFLNAEEKVVAEKRLASQQDGGIRRTFPGRSSMKQLQISGPSIPSCSACW